MADKLREKRIFDQRANFGKAPSASGRADKHEENKKLWEVLSFMHRPALSPKAIDYFKDGADLINTEVILGKNSKHPLKIKMPLIIADMSFGALSETAKLALAKGATKVGIAHSTGEGGVLPGEKELAKYLIIQYSTARFGWPKKEDYKTEEEFDAASAEYAKGCSAICFKFGQGAKPGQGGLLLANKITPRIAEIRKITTGRGCHSPASHQDIHNLDDLKNKIEWLRKISEGKPIIIKFGAGFVEDDIDLAIAAGADIIEIDGMEGGTGASPSVMLDEVGIATFPALIKAHKYLYKLYEDGKRNLPQLIIGGGIESGADVAKCLAFGADAVMIGIGFMKALGCIGCGKCHLGECEKGIATQNPNLEKNLILDAAAERVANYAISVNEEVKMLAAVCGKKNISDLDRADMCCRSASLLSDRVKKMTGIPMDYEDECKSDRVDNTKIYKK